ncbi:hypothetical protein BU17DRAFT_81563 [Hysterangium stoloniferum]|nr:hypothetical protein BU17DRAFT_81563 [Hysterangium stoloniferum]
MLTHLRRNLTQHNNSNWASFLQQRHSHQRVHRTINVKLLEDIPGVGARGSIQSVAPGRMRHVFYPQKQASYIIADANRRLPLRQKDEPFSTQEAVNFADLKARLRALDKITFQRSIASSKMSKSNGQLIEEPITMEDIAQRLNDNHNLTLLPPFVHLSLQESPKVNSIRTTGICNVLVHLQTGDILTVKVIVEPPETRDNDEVQHPELISAAIP